MNRPLILSVSALVLSTAAVAWQLTSANEPKLPPPYATTSARNHPTLVPKPADAELKVPAGFEVRMWAEGFAKPRVLLQAANGDILLADSGDDAATAAVGQEFPPGQRGAIYVFEGGDAARKKAVLKGLDRPYGIAVWKNYLYVAEPESVKRYSWDAGKREAGKGEEVVSYKGEGKGHWTRSLIFDRAGSKMYVGVGSGSNVDAGEDPRRAAIHRYNPDGSGHEAYATGVRNPTGLHFYPGTDTLWATVQERDHLGDNLVPDYFTSVKQGAFYGWPYAYTGPNEDPRRKGEKPDLVQKAIPGDLLLGAHVAAMDFTFYNGKQFPAEYRAGAFLALHGSWNRAERVGQSVVFVPFKNGKPAGDKRDFLTGWMISPNSKDVWGRPVGICEMRDGSLLISDDGGRKIWRVSHKG